MSEESTTPDLVELVRRAYEASSRRELDAMMSFYGPNSVWDVAPLGLGVYDGAAAIRGFFEDWMAPSRSLRLRQRRLSTSAAGSRLRSSSKAAVRSSDSYVRWRFAAVTKWVDGIAARTTNYTDMDEARTAAERLAEERQ